MYIRETRPSPISRTPTPSHTQTRTRTHTHTVHTGLARLAAGPGLHSGAVQRSRVPMQGTSPELGLSGPAPRERIGEISLWCPNPDSPTAVMLGRRKSRLLPGGWICQLPINPGSSEGRGPLFPSPRNMDRPLRVGRFQGDVSVTRYSTNGMESCWSCIYTYMRPYIREYMRTHRWAWADGQADQRTFMGVQRDPARTHTHTPAHPHMPPSTQVRAVLCYAVLCCCLSVCLPCALRT